MIETVTAAELPRLLDRITPAPAVLSLDCFDTLLWRLGQAPRDVFAELALPGGGVEPRMWAESRARLARRQADGTSEVTLAEIYAALMPHAGQPERDAAIAAELAAEARHCFAFAPTVQLMRAARARGMPVVVVSDTYLSEPQLRALIAAAGGADVAALIDRVFVSCEHRRSKGDGLFAPVLDALGVAPDAIFHLGDNKGADREAPRRAGIRAAHFVQFDADAEQRLRLEAAAATLIEPATRITLPCTAPHRAGVALRTDTDAAAALGHDVLGPLVHAFCGWVADEAAALAAAHGAPVKPLFLLRDGHLPHRMWAALHPEAPAAAVEISRFSARRASFRNVADIRAYLLAEPTERTEVLANQLLLLPAEAAKLGRDDQAFRRAVAKPEWVKRITGRSRAYATRLAAHLSAQGVARGDTIMLVDLGYNGTVQNLIAPVLEAELGVRVAGRYLLLRESEPSGLDKAGLFDTRHYDTRALHALCQPIAVVEQLCTAAQGSVVDYHPSGQPIRKAPGIKGAQSDTRDRAQAGAISYARHAAVAWHRAPAADGPDARRRGAMAVFARLLYLPRAAEVAVLGAFAHDVNLGTSDLERLVDPDAARDGLRRRGLSYINSVRRMYLPGELQPHGLPLTLALFGTSRLGLDLRESDFGGQALEVPVMVMDGVQAHRTTMPAHPTHDGFHLLAVPVGAGRYTVGIQLGAIAEWVQVEDVRFHTLAGFAEGAGGTLPAAPVFDAMSAQAPGLYRCTEAGLVFVPPPPVKDDRPLLLALTFRPLVARARAELRAAA